MVPPASIPHETPLSEKSDRRHVRFLRPLLQDGYPPVVLERLGQQRSTDEPTGQRKPILLYLPGLGGTLQAPFSQFPSLSEEFDVHGMTVDMDDRSTFERLKEYVIEYLLQECGDDGEVREVYLMGESFGGILAIEVASTLPTISRNGGKLRLKGLILINPATSYLRSNLYERGPAVANDNGPTWSSVRYVSSWMSRLVPLLLDKGRAFRQLMVILSSKGLPGVVNSPMREAYMGRVAFDLPNRLKFMPKETFKWRLEEWLEHGCRKVERTLERVRLTRSGVGDGNGDELVNTLREIKTLIVVGELDLTLPSIEEAERLASEVFEDVRVHVVEGAGHASTCGGSLNLMRLLRDFFPELSGHIAEKNNSDAAESEPREELHGLVPRYDNALVGMSPLRYWSKEHYREWKGDS